MRVLWKLSAFILLGTLIQSGLVRWANDIDESVFVFRMLLARIEGLPADHEESLRAAEALLQRQMARDLAAWKAAHPDRPHVVESIAAVDM